MRGEMQRGGEAVVNATLRRQGIKVIKVKKQSVRRGGSITDKDITLFTRQLATMMKAGVPLLQAFDIVGKGHCNPAVQRAADRHQDRSRDRLALAPRSASTRCTSTRCSATWWARASRPVFSRRLLDRLATYKEKILAIKGKIKAALFYPDRDHRGRVHHHRGDHDFRDPGVQAGVHELRRRPAGADADRDGDLGLLRQVLVLHLPRVIGGVSGLPRTRGSAR